MLNCTILHDDTESITRDGSHSSTTHTFNVMLPIKEASAEDTSVCYECIGQGMFQGNTIHVLPYNILKILYAVNPSLRQ